MPLSEQIIIYLIGAYLAYEGVLNITDGKRSISLICSIFSWLTVVIVFVHIMAWIFSDNKK